MKTLVRVTIATVELFKLGMEDGVRRLGEYIPRASSEAIAPGFECRAFKGYQDLYEDLLERDGIGFEESNWRPYIGEYSDPNAIINKGDYIVTSIKIKKGKPSKVREILRKEDFKSQWFVCEGDADRYKIQEYLKQHIKYKS